MMGAPVPLQGSGAPCGYLWMADQQQQQLTGM
jgi:hypothetical protein